MTHNIRKAWNTIRKLPNDPTTSKPKRPVLPPTTERDYSMVYPFSEEEYRKGVAIMKNNEASGSDDVQVEQLKTPGPKAYRWLLTMLNKCFMENKFSTLWTIQDYRHTEAWELLCDSKETHTNIPQVSYVLTLRKNDIELNSTNHRTTPN